MENAHEIFHFAHREIRQVAGVITHPEERSGLLGQLGQLRENVLLDDGLSVCLRWYISRQSLPQIVQHV